ncbi:hypothetical protein [Massilia endophytica]|uniref:hypothetical protein n=1 Tax=Massilia endophytica TaxID=2899220 RepID=UPI001E52BABF|nr:hypothetical protein [Massilia endophytica]UGQ48362.1 hypothetical protein LSQ66_07810 [Massilia endophytica]
MLPKQILYVSTEQIQACQWQGNEITALATFPATREGVEAFMEHMRERLNRPIYMIADVVEEDFARLLLPHVRGRPGRKMMERRITNHYRDTPFRVAVIQGRVTEGREDDIVLFSGLTNPSLLTPWIDALEAVRAPLAGVYSATLLSTVLPDRLALHQEHLLLVTVQSAGIRQSYFHEGQLKFSRLVQGAGWGSVDAETARTQQFLASIRLVEREDLLHVAVVTPPPALDILLNQCGDREDLRYHFVPMEAAAAAVHLDHIPELADSLVIQILGRNPPSSHYRLREKFRYYGLWRARISLFASSAVIGAAGIIWTIANIAGYAVAARSTEKLEAEAAHYTASYKRSMSSMPPAIEKTANMKAAVLIERLVAQHGPWPLHMTGVLSEALERSPQIRLRQLEWRALVPGAQQVALGPGPAAGAPVQAGPTSTLALGIPRAPAQSLRIEAEVLAAQDDYRAVLDNMNAFAQTLARVPRMTVEIEQLPVDVRSNVRLSGRAGASTAGGENRARFTLNMVYNP